MTFKFRVADTEGYLTAGEFPDGSVGEIFLQGREAGLDARRDHGCVRHLDLDGSAVRRAALGLREAVHEHPLRAVGHDRRPRLPDRDLDPRLRLPSSGARVPRRPRSVTLSASAPRASARPRSRRSSTPTARPKTANGNGNGNGNGHTNGGAKPEGVIVLGPVASAHDRFAPVLRNLRGPDAPGRLLLRLPLVRFDEWVLVESERCRRRPDVQRVRGRAQLGPDSLPTVRHGVRRPEPRRRRRSRRCSRPISRTSESSARSFDKLRGVDDAEAV